MAQRKEYILKIDAFTPSTIPMARLAEYMAELATLVGEHKSVHFVRLVSGSTRIAYKVEHEAEPKMRDRIRLVRSHDAPIDALRAARAIDKKLAEDNASGAIIEPTGGRILEFPGRKKFIQPVFGPFNQMGEIDGIPIRIGGEGDPVPVHLEEGNTVHICLARRDIARDLGQYLFKTMVRAQGLGRWTREKDGKWAMVKFTIHSARVLKVVRLDEALVQLRKVSHLDEVENPLGELETLRHGS